MHYHGSFLRLKSIMDELRAHCPWDKAQTLQSLRPLTIEEIYELADAIERNDWKGVQEELGDLLLHFFFYCKLADEGGHFTIEEVIAGIATKLIERHPHIYSHVAVSDKDEVKRNWEQIKMKTKEKTLLSGVPVSLPAMVKALRLQEKTKQVGFEWDHTAQVRDKLTEELNELDEAIHLGKQADIEEELGDVLFSLVNLARFVQVDPELALERTNKKFMARFTQMEAMATALNKPLSTMTLDEMDALWNKIKSLPNQA